MKKAFTLIELIFAIVVIGILASVAIVKINVTRVDAKAVKAKENLTVCITDIASIYTAKGIETTGKNNDASDYSKACKMVLNDNCFIIELSNFTDGNITVKDNNINKKWCDISHDLAHKENLSAPGEGLLFSFGGSKIK